MSNNLLMIRLQYYVNTLVYVTETFAKEQQLWNDALSPHDPKRTIVITPITKQRARLYITTLIKEQININCYHPVKFSIYSSKRLMREWLFPDQDVPHDISSEIIDTLLSSEAYDLLYCNLQDATTEFLMQNRWANYLIDETPNTISIVAGRDWRITEWERLTGNRPGIRVEFEGQALLVPAAKEKDTLLQAVIRGDYIPPEERDLADALYAEYVYSTT